MPGDAHRPHLEAGQVEVGVLGDREVGRLRRVEAVAAVEGDMVPQGVGHLLAAHEPGPGDDAPQVGARGVVAVLVGGQDVLDPARVEADGLDRRPLALEGQPGVGLDEDEAVRRLDDPLAAEVALDAAAGQLPHARPDRHGAGVGDPRLGVALGGLVEVGPPALLAAPVEQADHAVGAGDDDARAVAADAHQAGAAHRDALRHAGRRQVLLAEEGDAPVPAADGDAPFADGHVGHGVGEGQPRHLPGSDFQQVHVGGGLVGRQDRLPGQAAAGPGVRRRQQVLAVGEEAQVAPEGAGERPRAEAAHGLAVLVVDRDGRARRQEADAEVLVLAGRRRAHPALPALVVGGGHQALRLGGVSRPLDVDGDGQRGPGRFVALRQLLAPPVGQGRLAVEALFRTRRLGRVRAHGPAPQRPGAPRAEDEEVGGRVALFGRGGGRADDHEAAGPAGRGDRYGRAAERERGRRGDAVGAEPVDLVAVDDRRERPLADEQARDVVGVVAVMEVAGGVLPPPPGDLFGGDGVGGDPEDFGHVAGPSRRHGADGP